MDQEKSHQNGDCLKKKTMRKITPQKDFELVASDGFLVLRLFSGLPIFHAGKLWTKKHANDQIFNSGLQTSQFMSVHSGRKISKIMVSVP